MNTQTGPPTPFSGGITLFPERTARLLRLEILLQVVGVVAAVVRHGLTPRTSDAHIELGVVVFLAMGGMTASMALRHHWSLATPTFFRAQGGLIGLSLLWCAGLVGILIVGSQIPSWSGQTLTRGLALVRWSELLVVLRALFCAVRVTRRVAAVGASPPLLLVGSFLVLIVIGTMLLMLPRSRALNADGQVQTAPWSVALFTATSSSCVTGLTVEPTGSYWSRTGQTIILCLFQMGGLGIMTCGAFFALAAGRQMEIRETATLRDLLESDALSSARQLLVAVLLFTLAAETIGAVLLSGLWSDLPASDRVFYSVFHSVSGFCNAGFTLDNDGFLGQGTRWQVWGALSGLIITGGLGFAVLYNLAIMAVSRLRHLQRTPLFNLGRGHVRLTLASKLSLVVCAWLLLVGAVGIFLLESASDTSGGSLSTRTADAWFQSVTFRTAGFHTVEHGQMHPATKLFAILLMFIGAAPGSTGGGIKTACFALSILAIVSILRGHERVECFGRAITTDQINRALTIVATGMVVVVSSTLLLVLFESQADLFLNHLFEATSAFATVGVSTGITAELSQPSQLVLVVTMLVGRIGPLTLLLALTRRATPVRYAYPVERVPLG